MNIHEELWNAFSDIYFEEEEHKYTDSKGTKYSSVTGWYKQFIEEKDWDTIREKAAKKRGVNPEDLKKEWDKNSSYACDLGTQIHSVLENLWYKKDYRFDKRLNEKYPEMEEDFNFRKERCKVLFDKLKQIYVPVQNEFIVYDQPNGLCGTIDFLAWNKLKQCYTIIDWKTSKKFEKDNRYQRLKYPFSDYPECNCIEYSLQLSTYKAILEKHTSIRIGEMILFQIPGKDIEKPEFYRCVDFSDRIRNILDKETKEKQPVEKTE